MTQSIPKARETQLVIDSKSLLHNYRFLRERISNDTLFMAVVKANAYGSDAVAVSKLLEKAGAEYFAVAYTSEGINLRKAGIRAPILVLHPQSVHFTELIEHCLEPALYSHFVLEKFIEAATELKQNRYPVHLKFNTGLNRLGFHPGEAEKIAAIISAEKFLKIQSVFSHLAASEDSAERDFTLYQITHFNKIRKSFFRSLALQTPLSLHQYQRHPQLPRSPI